MLHPVQGASKQAVRRKRWATVTGVTAVDTERILELADTSPEAMYDLFEEHGWGDGLPLVPPTTERVDAMLAHAAGDVDESLGILPPRSGVVTRRIVAVNAVLAGCKPEYFPVVLSAARALTRPRSTSAA